MSDAADTAQAPARLSAPPRTADPSEQPQRLHLTKAKTDRPPRTPRASSGLSQVEVAAAAFTLVWLGLAAWFFLTLSAEHFLLIQINPFNLLTTVLVIFMPIALIWLAASAVRSAQNLRREGAILRAAIATLTDGMSPTAPDETATLRHDVNLQIEKITQAQAVLSAELAALKRPNTPNAILAAPVRPAQAAPRQPALALDTAPAAEPLPPEDFIRALNFPENERDQDGFRILRAALEHHPTARLVTAAQDLLTLLSQDGIFMDDLTVYRADPILWRAFASGTPGSDVAALGGIRDRSSLALTAGRMKDDPVFRDAVHHFLRTFGQVFATFAETASDGELVAFANTRTARAFMLCARVAGTFD